MNIGLIDVDNYSLPLNFPNIALMKISAYHKSIGDTVEWHWGFGKYDIVYMSKVFTYTTDYVQHIHSNIIVKGGTGYDFNIKLPDYIDCMCPDYSLYPMFKEAYGFITRGCPNKCNWCIVPKKEGNIYAYQDIDTFLDGRKHAVIMDNNILAHEYGLSQIEKIINLRIKVDFNQGLDARIIASNEDIAKLLAKVKYSKVLRMACDTQSQIPHIIKAAELLRKYDIKPKQFMAFVLVKDIEDAKIRIKALRENNIFPFAMAYRDFDKNGYREKNVIEFCGLVNHTKKSSTNKFDIENMNPKNYKQ